MFSNSWVTNPYWSSTTYPQENAIRSTVSESDRTSYGYLPNGERLIKYRWITLYYGRSSDIVLNGNCRWWMITMRYQWILKSAYGLSRNISSGCLASQRPYPRCWKSVTTRLHRPVISIGWSPLIRFWPVRYGELIIVCNMSIQI